MTVRFMRGTPAADLEIEMQQVPGFRPRKSGVIRSQYPSMSGNCGCCQYAKTRLAKKSTGMEYSGNSLERATAPFTYGSMLRRFAEELPVSALAVRVGRLQRESEGNTIYFKSEEHKRRFHALLRCELYPGILTEPGFAAAVFLLSSDSQLWSLAGPHVKEQTIDYNRLRLQGMDLDGYAVYCVAKELYTGKSYVTLSELGDPELFHDNLLRLIIHGILISRHGVGAVMNEEGFVC